MRILLLLALGAAAAWSAEPVSSDALEPEEHVPAAVTKLAEDYVRSTRKPKKPSATPAEAKRDFARMFLTGFTQPNVSIGDPNDAQARGLEAGRKYRRENDAKVKEILVGYGYAPIETDGFWRSGFEVSDFKPVKNPKENWWVTVLAEEGPTKADAAPRVQVERKVDGLQVHIVGFLSPEGHYGHFGVGVRELIATSVTAAKRK